MRTVVESTRNGGITATGLGKQFGDLWALRNLDLHVAPGTVLGLLGHNGAGKTTAIRILTTLSQPTEGSATVAGLDVVEHAAAVRGRIGVASQQSTVDGLMTARLNLQTIGRLRGMSKAAALSAATSCSSDSTSPTSPLRWSRRIREVCGAGSMSPPA